MADMTDSAFCRLVKSMSSPIMFREMVSAEAIVRGNDKTLGMTNIHSDERPIIQQIFGSDPDVMAKAAKTIVANHHPEGLDINMGCPVYKVVNNFNGSALMKDSDLATKIVQNVKAAVSVPVSVKIRSGWSNPQECLDFCSVLEKAGADLITIHGRTKEQGYTGQADWDIIREMKKRVSIPVLANGDIFSAPLALDALQQTKCDGIMIARGALGNPWIFKQIEELLANQKTDGINLKERVRTIKHHIRLHVEQYGEIGVRTFRKHLTWYFKSIPGAKQYKERLHTVSAVEELNNILNEMLATGLPDNGLSPRDATHPDAHLRTRLTK